MYEILCLVIIIITILNFIGLIIAYIAIVELADWNGGVCKISGEYWILKEENHKGHRIYHDNHENEITITLSVVDQE